MPAPGRGDAARRRPPGSASTSGAGSPADRAQARDRAATRPAARPARPGRPAPPRRPNGAGTAARRPTGPGLTAAGAAVFGFGGTLLGGLLDQLVTDRLGFVFGLAFVLSAALVAWKVRIQDWIAAIIVPPIGFAATIVLVSTFLGADTNESYLARVGLDLVTALSFKAGLLWGGTALAAAVALVRHRMAART
ncbi:DUF6542 domain-containing protein [Embleya sp. AB8]|uniref:DUF6542 domain-containing protein n=1 Tax=Embleya sp. AB8 TaxID=3156304 RepID=UPI003C77AD6F